MGESTPVDQRLWWVLVAAVLLLAGVVRLLLGSSDDRRTLGLLALYLGVPLLATWYSAQNRPIFNERYLVAALPPFYLLIAAAFGGRHFDRPIGLAIDGVFGLLSAMLVVGMLLSLNRSYHDPAYSKTRGWRDLATAIDRLSAGLPPDRVRVAQNFPDPTLWYYYRGPVDHLVLPPAANDGEAARHAAEVLAGQGVQRVILPVQPAANWDDSGLALMALDGLVRPRRRRRRWGCGRCKYTAAAGRTYAGWSQVCRWCDIARGSGGAGDAGAGWAAERSSGLDRRHAGVYGHREGVCTAFGC